jgi:signal transduction histidine kinase
VSMMGGTLTVHSAPGAGSVFRVTLTYQRVQR